VTVVLDRNQFLTEIRALGHRSRNTMLTASLWNG